MRILGGTAAAAGMSLPMAACGGGSSTDKKVIVLGLDGLDPKILSALMEMGRLPNFKKLAEMGSLQPLATTMPALSPVAWSSFITGMTPGGHGIADFIARNPSTYTPEFAIYENTEPEHHDLGRRCPPADQGWWAGQQSPGQALLGLSHRARHPGLDLQDPDQLSGRGDRHQGDRRHGHPGPRRLLRRLLLLHLRSLRGLPQPRRRRDPLRRRQLKCRPLQPARVRSTR